jgi:hypothetical protein
MTQQMDKAKAKLTVCIVKDDPKYIDKNPVADAYYEKITAFVKAKGVEEVLMVAGKEFSIPPMADLWIGHGKGAERRKFMSKDSQAYFLVFGHDDGIIADDDREWRKSLETAPRGEVSGLPPESHFTFTKLQQEAVADMIERVKMKKKV